MIDLILQGTAANIHTLLRGRGLLDANDNPAPGFDYCLWAGNGKFMTAKPVFGNGPFTQPTVAATYLTGIVVLARIATPGDAINEGAEQWQRSQVAKWIKTNGTQGTFGGFPCHTASSVRMMRAADVFDWCATNDMPPHEWLGGNSI